MKNMILFVSTLFLSLPAMAAKLPTKYSCGQLKYRGEAPLGGPIFSVIKNNDNGKVYLESRPMHPRYKTTRTLAKPAGGAGEMTRYTVGEMDLLESIMKLPLN